MIQTVIRDRLGIDRGYDAVRHAAARIGITCRKGTFWTEEDVAFLEEMACTMTPLQISNKLHRSISSIYHKAYKQGIQLGSTSRHDWYNLEDLMEIFSVTSDTIHKWVKDGLLKQSIYNHATRRFEQKDVKSFICKYPMMLNGRNVDLCQLVDILVPNDKSKDGKL